MSNPSNFAANAAYFAASYTSFAVNAAVYVNNAAYVASHDDNSFDIDKMTILSEMSDKIRYILFPKYKQK